MNRSLSRSLAMLSCALLLPSCASASHRPAPAATVSVSGPAGAKSLQANPSGLPIPHSTMENVSTVPAGTLPGQLSAIEGAGGICFMVDDNPIAWPVDWYAKKIGQNRYAVTDSFGKQVAISGSVVTLDGGFLGEVAQLCERKIPTFTAFSVEVPSAK